MRLTRLLSRLLPCMLLVGIVQAETLPVPKVDYSGDRLIETEDATFSIRVYASGNKERSEMDMGGMKMVNILRPDKGVAWMLMPMQRMYQEVQIGQAMTVSPGVLPDNVLISNVGQEKLGDQNTTKYKLTLKDKSAGGFVWINSDGIAVKMDIITKDGDEKTRTKMTLQNLKIGKQDPKLFELPAGYEKMPDFGGMGGGMGSGMGGGMGAMGNQAVRQR